MQENWDWEVILGKLELIALMGNERAEQTLYNIEKITNFELNGIWLEQQQSAIRNLEWLKSKT